MTSSYRPGDSCASRNVPSGSMAARLTTEPARASITTPSIGSREALLRTTPRRRPPSGSTAFPMSWMDAGGSPGAHPASGSTRTVRCCWHAPATTSRAACRMARRFTGGRRQGAWKLSDIVRELHHSGYRKAFGSRQSNCGRGRLHLEGTSREPRLVVVCEGGGRPPAA
jgi:hypothetical protein